MSLLRTYFALAAVFMIFAAKAQLLLNEACGKNNIVIANAEGIYTDWVEVYNTGSTPLDLSDYFFSDDANDLQKWQLPTSNLGANAFALFFAEEDVSAPFYFDFRLSQDGEFLFLSDNSGTIISQLATPYLHPDHSFGSYQENAASSFFFGSPTPGSSNTSTAFKGYAETPEFSPASTFFSSNLLVSISGPTDHDIHFTTNGQIPDQSSTLYQNSFALNFVRSFQARAYADSLLPSELVASSYIIHQDSELPVFVLQVDPDSMFDPILGMHVLGPNADPDFPFWGANYWAERELPVAVEFFTATGVKTISQQAGIRIHGGRASRTHQQKPLRLTARSEYGDKDFDQVFFEERPDVGEFKRVILRNSGSDFCESNIRDGFWHQLALHNELNVDVLAFQPCEVYLNGDYWGILNIRERIDENHIEGVYGADKDSVLIMEEENWLIQGDTMVFYDLNQFILNEDMSDPLAWQHVDEQIDIASMMDYFALQMMAGNPDWPSNNLKYWKPSVTQGKWRYFFFDLDGTLNAFGWNPHTTDPFDYLFNIKQGWMHTEVFRSLHGNEEFQRLFINRFADLINTSFSSDSMLHELMLIQDELGRDISDHWGRWCWDPTTWEHNTMGLLPSFMSERQQIVRDHIENWYGLEQQHRIKFEVFPPGAGTIEVNTIRPPLPFYGIYFEGNPIDITVIPEPGMVFDRWQYGDDQEEALSWQWDPDALQTVTAYFKNDLADLQVFPNPSNDRIFVALNTASSRDITIQLADAAGRVLAEEQRDLQAGANKLEFDVSSLLSGVYFIKYKDELTSRSLRFVKH